MKQAWRLSAVLICVIAAALAWGWCRRQPPPADSTESTQRPRLSHRVAPTPTGPPTVWACIVEVTDNEVRLLSARPSYGRPTAAPDSSKLAAVRARNVLWLQYALRKADLPLGNGSLAISMTAVAEPQQRGEPAVFARLRRRVVTIAMPYEADATSVVFSRAEPSNVPPEKWERISMGRSWPLVVR